MDTIGKLKEIGATVYLSTAGGGAAAITDLCSPPGRSSVILGATFINDTDLFKKYIGVQEWSKYASYESAKALSVASQEVGKNGLKHIGIGIASSLATNNERVGRLNLTNIVATGFNFEVSVSHDFKDIMEDVNIDTNEKRKLQENRIADLLNWVLEITYRIIKDKYKGDIDKIDTVVRFSKEIIFEAKIKNVDQHNIVEDSITIYPGSFNPIHDAHRDLKVLSETLTSTKTVFEISLVNFEKKRIDFDELNKRIQLIREDVIVSYDKTFVEKYNSLVKNYPHLRQINFVCGIDTWDRIDKSDIAKLRDTGKVKFLVFGRNGKWLDNYADLVVFGEVLHQDERLKNYNNPLSSSKIRASKI